MARSTKNRRKPETKAELQQVEAFLAPYGERRGHFFTEEQWWESYHCLGHGGRAWHRLQLGGTRHQAALAWYQHIHKPGSREWRPSIIIEAVCLAAGLEPSNDNSTASN